ncbi:MAG: hypothetical protein FWC43_05085 [Planctomycetaceae bacterium]|nr:hypothetical protein [Planctomycetaceae bacterium]
MSGQPLTYEGVLELIRELKEQISETDRQMKETDRQMKETDRQVKRTSQEISSLGSRVGEIVENMVGGDIVEQFQTLGYAVTALSRNKIFGIKGTSESGEIDLFLENGDVAILVETKTTLKIDDVKGHITKLKKYRRYTNENGSTDKRKFIGAVAAGSVTENVIKFAQRQGLYVIVQAGRTVKIIPPPEGFQAKEW